MKRFMIGMLLLICGWSIQAQTNSKSLLWKIERNDIQTSYLYGTIHLIPQGAFEINEKVTEVFNTAEQIVLEIDMDDPKMQMKMMQNAMMKDETTLDQLFSEEDYRAVSNALKETMGVGLEAVNKMKPFVISSMLITNLIEGTPASFEMSFVQMAKAKELEILGLETIEYQMSIFDKIPYQEQAKDVVDMVRNEEASREEFAAMVKAYREEDIDGLYEIIESYADTTTEMEELLVKRNQNWIPAIGELTKEKVSFIGVGAGHLGGEQGVINLLKEAGYTVTPMK
ncbi:MAG: TraB/GumN family protein [Cytophagales bacterium]|nr:TraB/GumN family protein [Cytophagales bacterium]